MMRNSLVSLILYNRLESQRSRHVVLTILEDELGNTETEKFSINNWSAISKTNAKQVHVLNGECVIKLHVYHTKCSILVQGKDAPTFMELAKPSLLSTIDKLDPVFVGRNADLKAKLSEAVCAIKAAVVKKAKPGRKKDVRTSNDLHNPISLACRMSTVFST